MGEFFHGVFDWTADGWVFGVGFGGYGFYVGVAGIIVYNCVSFGILIFLSLHYAAKWGVIDQCTKMHLVGLVDVV